MAKKVVADYFCHTIICHSQMENLLGLFKRQLGLTTEDLALFLQVPRSTLSMALLEMRNLPDDPDLTFDKALHCTLKMNDWELPEPKWSKLFLEQIEKQLQKDLGSVITSLEQATRKARPHLFRLAVLERLQNEYPELLTPRRKEVLQHWKQKSEMAIDISDFFHLQQKQQWLQEQLEKCQAAKRLLKQTE